MENSNLIHHPMDFIQKVRDFLDFVDNDPMMKLFRDHFFDRMGIFEPIPLKLFAEFLDYFGRVLARICGGYILLSISPPQIGSKIGSKEPKNRLKLFSGIGSLRARNKRFGQEDR